MDCGSGPFVSMLVLHYTYHPVQAPVQRLASSHPRNCLWHSAMVLVHEYNRIACEAAVTVFKMLFASCRADLLHLSSLRLVAGQQQPLGVANAD